jgi:hypothetical protein
VGDNPEVMESCVCPLAWNTPLEGVGGCCGGRCTLHAARGTAVARLSSRIGEIQYLHKATPWPILLPVLRASQAA